MLSVDGLYIRTAVSNGIKHLANMSARAPAPTARAHARRPNWPVL